MAAARASLLVFCLLVTTALSLPTKTEEDQKYQEDVLQALASDQNLDAKELAAKEDSYPEEKEGYGEEVTQHLSVVPEWPNTDPQLGQVGGVAIDTKANLVLLHRGSRLWGFRSFNNTNHYTEVSKGPIKEDTLLTLDPATGKVIKAAGKNKFYMPHGLTIDHEDNVWVTDVAMHQVFKFVPGKDEPALTLGKAFTPVSDVEDNSGFCQPTDVAVASTGDFYVSDGYCNSRVLKYNKDGELVGKFGEEEFDVPHSLALIEELDVLCVADREHRRIACYNAGLQVPRHLGRPEREYSMEYLGRVFALDYNPGDGLLYALNGPIGKLPGEGFTIDLTAEDAESSVIDAWSPNEQGFDAPHDLAVSPNGDVYVGEVGPNNIWKFVSE